MNKKRKKIRLSWNKKCCICMFPAIIGTLVFSLIPFIRVVYYSGIKNQFDTSFALFSNYERVWKNEYFRIAFKNSVQLILICVPILVVIAILISLILVFGKMQKRRIQIAFILPMVIPTAGIAVIWRQFFSEIDNIIPVYLLFIWKNVGICIILLTAAFASIQKDVYEAAYLEGANSVRRHIYMTLPISAPTIFFTTLLSIVNSFRIFKESYLYYGTNYPPDYGYTLQYYMNNHFLKLNYQNLSASAVFSTLFAGIVIAAGMSFIRRFQN